MSSFLSKQTLNTFTTNIVPLYPPLLLGLFDLCHLRRAFKSFRYYVNYIYIYVSVFWVFDAVLLVQARPHCFCHDAFWIVAITRRGEATMCVRYHTLTGQAQRAPRFGWGCTIHICLGQGSVRSGGPRLSIQERNKLWEHDVFGHPGAIRIRVMFWSLLWPGGWRYQAERRERIEQHLRPWLVGQNMSQSLSHSEELQIITWAEGSVLGQTPFTALPSCMAHHPVKDASVITTLRNILDPRREPWG